MSDAFDQTGPTVHGSVINRWNWALAKVAEAGPSLLYALRLWAAVLCASCSSGLRCARAGSG